MMQRQNLSQDDIRKVFYNGLVDQLTRGLDFNFTRENLPGKIQIAIAELLQAIFVNSTDVNNGLRLPGLGEILTTQNCPNLYLPLLTILLELKKQPEIPTLFQLSLVAAQMMELPSFQQMNPSQELLQMAGVEDVPLQAHHYSQAGVTPELIQQTFYNEMLQQTLDAIANGWMLLEDVNGHESHVFFACPALTLLQAIQESMQCSGIRVLNDKMVTLANCPQSDSYPGLVEQMLKIKEEIGTLSQVELLVIRQLLTRSDEDDESPELEARRTARINKAFAAIKGLAVMVTQRGIFSRMVTLVFARCKEILDPAPVSSPSLRK